MGALWGADGSAGTARVSQREIPRGQRFDFLLSHRTAGWTRVEVKNVREWLYPDRTEVKDMLAKAGALDAVPVLIARRIPCVTFKLFHRVRNEPDAHLRRFIQQNLPEVLPRPRERFEAYKDLLGAYGTGHLSYPAFAARVRRRQSGAPEDHEDAAAEPLDEHG